MNKEKKEVDIIILGGGPAGFTAAIFAGKLKLNVILFEKNMTNRKIKNSYTVEDYPGFKKIEIGELLYKMRNQALCLGTVIEELEPIERVDLSELKEVETPNYIYKAKVIIISTGAKPKKLDITNEEKFEAKGIHYCAVCDGPYYKDKVVAVVGDKKQALEETRFLSKLAKKVYLITEDDKDVEINLSNEDNKNIEVLKNTKILDVFGKDFLEGATVLNTSTNKEEKLELEAIFGCLGVQPKTDFIKGKVELDDDDYIITDDDMKTNIDGVYAAGDVRKKKYRQLTTAVSDGTIACLAAEKYIMKSE